MSGTSTNIHYQVQKILLKLQIHQLGNSWQCLHLGHFLAQCHKLPLPLTLIVTIFVRAG